MMLTRLRKLTLSVVMLLPWEPQPRVNEGIMTLNRPPMAPWLVGELKVTRLASTLLANSMQVSSLAEWIPAV